ncbi:hypothetical protein C6I20_16790 [Aeromicrobium sp. A1-2]|uniref:hypothetical protein n=1 Tax=Aeromicrobium sp. A1-2 TaxID=2107713 RepID=UPI000E4F64A5|nr:hypothetical protein [Aeromicrobium sp. A1-2]AXT86658.1 hypothetical protein C6I20_16790 [Aeromicrobium sp. A1-2]
MRHDSEDRSDSLTRAAHELVTETASHQISREIAHLAEINVDSHGVHAVSPPAGYRAPESGVITTHVLARSRDVPEATVETRVAVWIAEPGTESSTVLLTRADSDRTLELAAEDLVPEPSTHGRGQVNDFVAVIIAHMVSELSSEMQRVHARESTADVAEYDGP